MEILKEKTFMWFIKILHPYNCICSTVFWKIDNEDMTIEEIPILYIIHL